MADPPVARGPVTPGARAVVRSGWEVSDRWSAAALRLADHSPLAKVGVRSAADGPLAARLGVRHGRAERDADGCLVVGSGPGEWLLLAAVGSAPAVAARIRADDDFVTVLDLTHGRAMLRLSGVCADRTLSKVCAIDLSDRVSPDGTAFRSSVARLVTDVIRDDRDGMISYLLHCERSSGQYLFDTLLDAGAEWGIEPDGFDRWEGP